MTTKSKLLDYLKAQKGNWISGEMISNDLAVSRSAIWKHVGKLREAGYRIESSPKKGYCLETVPDVLTEADIQEGLNTKYFAKSKVYCFDQTDSTNIQAKRLAEDGALEGTLVTAESQTKGKGRKGRVWHSAEGAGLYFSMVLRPKLPPSEAPKMTLTTAVAVAEALNAFAGIEAKIKWPNDILVKGRKIAGILTEISTDTETINYVIVGIGLNVNHGADAFPDELHDIATSLKVETGHSFLRSKILQAMLEKIEHHYHILNDSGFDPIMTQWKKMSDIIGQRVKVDVINTTHIGRVVDVDRDGVLILKDDANAIHRIFSGDVSRLRPKKA